MILKVTLSDEELAIVDRLRGGQPRSTYVRGLVRAAGGPVAEGERLVERARETAKRRRGSGKVSSPPAAKPGRARVEPVAGPAPGRAGTPVRPMRSQPRPIVQKRGG